jgi:hypothetical protein
VGAPRADSRWLFGPWLDLGLGCGAAYCAIFAVLLFAGEPVQRWLPLALAPFASTLFSAPHYGATLLRACEQSDDRRAHGAFALWVTLGLLAAFAVGLADPRVASLLVTIYLTWSPWHYTGQNYGIAVMFLRRRGVELEPATRRLLHASFALSFALAFLALHSAAPGSSYAPSPIAAGSVRLLPLGIPLGLADAALVACGLGYLAATSLAARALARRARPVELLPVAVLVLTQALWFALPVAVRRLGWLGGLLPFAPEHALYAFVWVAIGHAVQYLWITSYYASTSGRPQGSPAFVMKALLAGVALWVAPVLLLAPGGLGVMAYDGGLAQLVAAFVNLHHFILDGAIWKLRDARLGRILIRGGARREGAARPEPGRSRRVWTIAGPLGAACLALALLADAEGSFGVARALERGDLGGLERAVRHLSWAGRDSAELRFQLGRLALRAGDPMRARAELERSLRLAPNARAHLALGEIEGSARQWRAAVEHYDRALELEPDSVVGLTNLALVWLELGEPERARALLVRAVQLAPDEPRVRAVHERAARASAAR